MTRRLSPFWWLTLGGLLVMAGLFLGCWYFLSPTVADVPVVTLPPEPADASPEQVQQFCGACHASPPPDVFPRSAWRMQVKQGYDFYRGSLLRLEVPPLESVVGYYQRRAPESLPPAVIPAEPAEPWLRWQAHGLVVPDRAPTPEVTHVALASLLRPGKLDLLVCDNRLGQVLACFPDEQPPRWQVLGQASGPCHVEVVDLDGDGHKDLLVANLGSLHPSDDKVGSVLWLRGSAEGKFTPITLLDGVGRVADVQVADLDGDGKLDLVVAVFGWRTTGEVLFLRNETTDWQRPRFSRHVLGDRHGAINVCIGDVNGDGRPDVVALLSQEHETVVAFLNQGQGQFQKQTLWQAPHPAFSCSGMQLVDLDGDGRLDVLLTNGDVLDAPYLLKPFHGVWWLENTGQLPLTAHLLTPMYGVMRAVAADLDGDGDLDVVAVSHLPASEFPRRQELGLDSIVVLEQTSPGKFVRRSLEKGTCDHFSCAVGDLDGDGRPDVVTSNCTFSRQWPIADSVRLWRNLGRK